MTWQMQGINNLTLYIGDLVKCMRDSSISLIIRHLAKYLSDMLTRRYIHKYQVQTIGKCWVGN